jgi:hypothetical protein
VICDDGGGAHEGDGGPFLDVVVGARADLINADGTINDLPGPRRRERIGTVKLFDDKPRDHMAPKENGQHPFEYADRSARPEPRGSANSSRGSSPTTPPIARPNSPLGCDRRAAARVRSS